jgi:hypothetical protein
MTATAEDLMTLEGLDATISDICQRCGDAIIAAQTDMNAEIEAIGNRADHLPQHLIDAVLVRHFSDMQRRIEEGPKE